MGPPSPVWKYFHKHHTKYKNNQTHFKAWCKYCLARVVGTLVAQENEAVSNGTIDKPRDMSEIEESVITQMAAAEETTAVFGTYKLQTLKGHIGTLYKHLNTCLEAPQAAKDEAGLYLAGERKGNKHTGRVLPSLPDSPAVTPAAAVGILSPPGRAASTRASTPALTPSSSHASLRPSLTSPVFYNDSGSPAPPMSSVLLSEFHADICWLLVSGLVSWRAVELPYWRHFFAKWIPGAILPSRQVISGRILNEEVAKADEATRGNVQGRFGTGQSDGWKNVAKQSLITGMVNVEYTPHILNVTDISAKPKTAETLLDIILKEIEYVQKVLLIILVAWCTDASGESLKMRRLLRELFEWIVVLDCWAHQLNLVVGDVLKLKVPLIKVVDEALQVIKWFLSHSLALGLLKKEQANSGSAVILVLILPVLTRWTSHYLALDCLLALKEPLRRLVVTDSLHAALITAAGKTSAAKTKARRILTIISRDSFWTDIKSLRDLLRPFAIATNAAQADNCRLDTILLLLGYLYHTHSASRVERRIRDTIHASLEKRWKKADQDVFILSVIFNPYIRQNAFKRGGPFRSTADLWHIVETLFKRFYDKNPDSEFRRTFSDYLGRAGKWSDERMSLAWFRQDAKEQNTSVDIVQVWREQIMSDVNDTRGSNGMVVMAMRICSIVPNSASAERIFSRFAAVHTKARNRMTPERTRKIVILSNHIQRKHGVPPDYKHRRNEDAQNVSEATTSMAHQPGNDIEEELRQGLDTLDIGSVDGSEEGDDEDDPGDLDAIPIASFHEVAREIMEADEEEDTEDDLTAEEARKLKNLFDYPSLSHPNDQTFAFMTEFWQRGERGLQAETTRHESFTNEFAFVDSDDDEDL